MSGFWKVIAGRGNQYVRDFEEQGCIAVGGSEMGDLTRVATPSELARVCEQTCTEENWRRRSTQLRAITRFRFEMQPGDAVIIYDPNTREYLWGDITGEYAYQEGRVGDYPNVRDVRWGNRIGRDSLSENARNQLMGGVPVVQMAEGIRREFEAIIQGTPVEPTPETEEAAEDVILESQVEKARELIKDRLSRLGWEDMQELVAAVLRAMGYRTRVSPAGPDKGKDVVASPDGLGLEEPRIKVEVKHRKGAMGAQDIRSFLGGLRQGDKGVYVSTGGFSKEAEYEAERANIPLTLVDLDTLTSVLLQHYENLDSQGRALIPLTRIYWPAD